MLLQFKIQLKHLSKPTVWRRVLIPSNFSFDKFHEVIQRAFGWQNAHLYEFSPGGYGSSPVIGLPSNEDFGIDDADMNSKKTKLSKIFKAKGQKYIYIYDFGDDWIHKIILEEIIDLDSKNAILLSGKGACPPEDCGGPWGYFHMLQILNDPEHEEYEETKEWFGLNKDENWDAKNFDLKLTKEYVESV